MKQELVFVTNDICLFVLAKSYFSKVEQVENKTDEYSGYKELSLSHEDLAKFYSNPSNYTSDILLNQYIILDGYKEEVYKKTDKGIEKILYPVFKSNYFGTIKPRDEY